MKEAIIEFEEKNSGELIKKFIEQQPDLKGLDPDMDIDTIIEHPEWFDYVHDEFINTYAR